MRVHAPQHQPIPQPRHHRTHPCIEQTTPRPEVLLLRAALDVGIPVRLPNQRLNAVDLRLQLVQLEPHGRLVVHRMVAQLVAGRDDLAQHLLAALDLPADDEHGGMRIVVAQELQDLARVLGRRVVDGEGDELRRGGGERHLPENVGPAVLEGADEQPRGPVDYVEGKKEEGREGQEEEECGHAVAAGAALEFGGEADEGREAHVIRGRVGRERWEVVLVRELAMNGWSFDMSSGRIGGGRAIVDLRM